MADLAVEVAEAGASSLSTVMSGLQVGRIVRRCGVLYHKDGRAIPSVGSFAQRADGSTIVYVRPLAVWE